VNGVRAPYLLYAEEVRVRAQVASERDQKAKQLQALLADKTPPNDDAEAQRNREELVVFVRSKAQPAFELALSFFDDVLNRLRISGTEDLTRIAFLSERQFRIPAQTNWAETRHALDSSAKNFKELQSLVGVDFVHYQWLFDWSHELGERMKVDFATNDQHRRLRIADRELLEALKALAARSAFDVLRLKVSEVGFHEATRAKLPVP
jgi:hypothetical protein